MFLPLIFVSSRDVITWTADKDSSPAEIERVTHGRNAERNLLET